MIQPFNRRRRDKENSRKQGKVTEMDQFCKSLLEVKPSPNYENPFRYTMDQVDSPTAHTKPTVVDQYEPKAKETETLT